MLTKEHIIATVGEKQYREECQIQAGFAAHPDFEHAFPPHWDRLDDNAFINIPLEIADLVWTSGSPDHAKIKLCMDVYDEMPAYGFIMHLGRYFDTFSPGDQAYAWEHLRERLTGACLALAQPIAYMLSADYIRGVADHVPQDWAALTRKSIPSLVLRGALIHASHVPWSLKAHLYGRLLPEPAWHRVIFDSVWNSVIDPREGDIDLRAALDLLSHLQMPHDIELRAGLEQKLRRMSATPPNTRCT